MSLCDPMDVAHQAPLSMRVLQARILEWAAMPSSMDLPKLEKEPRSSMSPALAGGFFSTSTMGFLGSSGVKNLLLQELQETWA